MILKGNGKSSKMKIKFKDEFDDQSGRKMMK